MKALLMTIVVTLLTALLSTVCLAQDPVQVSPDHYSVLLENEMVRVLEMKMKPGEQVNMHSHPSLTAYVVKGGKIALTYPDAPPTERELADGAALWHGGEAHTLKNIGDTDFHLIIIENLSSANSSTKP